MTVPCVVEPQGVQSAIYKSAMAADLTAAHGRTARQRHGLEEALLPLPAVDYFLGGAVEARLVLAHQTRKMDTFSLTFTTFNCQFINRSPFHPS